MAGHSKWAQIKHKKAITDAKKGKLFSKMVREIMVAARAGASLDINHQLRAAVERARSQGLPKENIERAVERGSGAGDSAKLQEFLYEATAPEGVMLLIEGITDNKNRSLPEVRHLISEFGARMADPGSVLWNFEKIGTVEVSADENTFKQEDLELSFIDCGAKEFKYVEGIWVLETGFTEREEVRACLEKGGTKISQTGHDFKPRNPIQLTREATEKMGPLLDSLLDHDDVQEVYTNFEN